jgi:ubiquitin-protein ligase E3 A
VTKENCTEYISLAQKFYVEKANLQMEFFLKGFYEILPKIGMTRISWRTAEQRAVGEKTIDIELLKSFTKYTGRFDNPNEKDKKVIAWFWEVLEEMTNEDRCRYWKFVNGSSKLALNFRDQAEIHKVGPITRTDCYPISHTCFSTLDLPDYSNKEILRDKLTTAVRLCGEIDND